MNSKTAHWIFAAVIIVADLHAPGTERSAQAQAPATPTVSSPPPLPPPTSSPLPTPLAKPVVPKPVVIPYDQQHYQVSISFGVDPDAGVSDRDARRMVGQLRSLVESRMGVWWRSDVTAATAGDPLSRAMLSSRTAESWNLALEPTLVEKKFALTLDREGTAFRISGVEWDRASQSVTMIQQRSTYDRRLLPTLAADLVFELFRPVVSIEKVVENEVELRIRGGEHLPPDVSLIPYAKGDYVTTFLRHLGKARELKRLQVIPWTMIRVETVERGYVQGTIISSFKAPFAGNRRRVEMLGLKIQPLFAQTKLRVIPRGKPQAPMVGYRVEVLDRPETKDDKVTDRITLRTDRNGLIVLPADPAKRIRYVTVFSGASPLASAPVYPGLVPQLVLEAPDDAPRLNVEAETELLESELVDLVARREVIMARARGACKKANWELVTDMEKQVDALPTLAQFLTRIEALKNPALLVAQKNKDRAQESRIQRMCKAITDLATQHLDPEKVKVFHVEMDDEKKAK